MGLFDFLDQGKNYRKNYKDTNSANRGGWYRCTYCGKGVRFSDADIDHIWPKSRGGSNSSWNLEVACQSCNRSKGNKIDGRVIKGFVVKVTK